eukprot:39246_1
MYQVFHYKNNEFRNQYDKSQKLYHGSTITHFSTYDKEQLFFKTITSFSLKDYIAKEFAGRQGLIFILKGPFIALYEGVLRGADMQWLSDYNEYEFVVLPTTYNNIKYFDNHGLLLNPNQNVYITSYFKTNINPFVPHSDTVNQAMNISYEQFYKKNKQYNIKHLKYSESDHINHILRRRQIRSNNGCNIEDCDFEHGDTIPPQQLDINVFSKQELLHIQQYHHEFYLVLKTWTKREDNDNSNKNKKIKWSKLPEYFIQITAVDLDDFHVELTCYEFETSKKKQKYFVKEITDDDNIDKVESCMIIKPGEKSAGIDIDFDEDHHSSFLLGLYKNKKVKHRLPNSNSVHLVMIKDDTKVPPKNLSYKPDSIDCLTVIKCKDERKECVNIFWSIPSQIFGEISYKITNNDGKVKDIISFLPYSIPLSSIPVSFNVITIATIDQMIYQSVPSKCIIIE